MIVELVICGLTLALLLCYWSTRKPSTMPPGSYGYPIIGHLPDPSTSITKHMQTFKDKYGKIFTTKWGSRPIVVLADHNLVKKAFSHPDFQGRVDFYSFNEIKLNLNIGIVFSEGEVWKNNRRFTMRHLRDLGMGKTHLETSIHRETEMLVDYLEKNSTDKLTDIDFIINTASLNVIWQMLASKRYDGNDPEIVRYNRMVSENLEVLQGWIFLVDFFPWLQYVLPSVVINKFMRMENVRRNRDTFFAMFDGMIEEHEATLDRDNPRDIIDMYLMEIEATKDDPNSTFRADRKDLYALMGDMFVAGSETTSTTVRWIVLYMALNPEVQSKAHKVLDSVVPKERIPSLEDRSELAYIDAILLEVSRLAGVAAIAIAHCTTANVNFEGYTIPERTTVMATLGLIHRDPELWEHPDEFYPEHFLDADGKLVGKREGFMPFGTGRRQCLGELLARAELFLFCSAILQRFTIKAPEGVTLSTECDPTKKLLNSPKPFKVILNKRG